MAPRSVQPPKGLHYIAQGCRLAATLGLKDSIRPTPKGLRSVPYVSFIKIDFVLTQQCA